MAGLGFEKICVFSLALLGGLQTTYWLCCDSSGPFCFQRIILYGKLACDHGNGMESTDRVKCWTGTDRDGEVLNRDAGTAF